MQFSDLPAEVRQQTLSYLLPPPRTSPMLVVCPCISDPVEEVRWACGCFNNISPFWPKPPGPTNIAFLTCPNIALASRTTLGDIRWLRRTSSPITEITACSVACAYNFLASQSNATGARLTSVTIEYRTYPRLPLAQRQMPQPTPAVSVDLCNSAEKMLRRFYPSVEKWSMSDLSAESRRADGTEWFTRRIGVSMIRQKKVTKTSTLKRPRKVLMDTELPGSYNLASHVPSTESRRASYG